MMRSASLRASAAATACAALTLVACGSDDPAAPFDPAPTAAPGRGETVSADQLTAALLADDDLPGDFTALPPRSGSEPPAVPSVALTEPADCARLLTPIAQQWPGSSGTAAVQFAGPGFATIDIDAASYSDQALPAAFAAVQDQPRRCTRYSGEDEGVRIDYRAENLPQPPAGDASSAFQLTATSDGLTLTSATSLVQVGNVLVQITVTAPETVDPGVLTDLTAAQVRKLRG